MTPQTKFPELRLPICIENLDIFAVTIPITLLSLSCTVGSTNLSLSLSLIFYFLVSFFLLYFCLFLSFFIDLFFFSCFFFPLLTSSCFFFLDVINFPPLFLNSYSACSVSNYQISITVCLLSS